MANYDLGQLIWKITGNAVELLNEVKTAETKIGKFAANLKKIGKSLTLRLTTPIFGAATAAVKAASDLEESLNAVNVVFGRSASVIEQWGMTAATSAGISQTQFNEAATVLGSSLKNVGLPMGEVTDLTIRLTQRAADMASVFNTDVNDALGAIQAALRGEIDPIERYGVGLSAVRVEAKAMALGLADTKAKLTDLDKATARVALLFEQTDQVAGDFANTSDGLANGTRILKAQVVDLAADLGKQLLPIAKEIITALLGLVENFNKLTDEQKKTVLIVAGLVAALGPALTIIGNVTAAAGKLGDAFKALGVSGGPVLLAVAAIGTLATVIFEIDKEIAKSQLESFISSLPPPLKNLQEELGLTNEAMQGTIIKLEALAASNAVGFGADNLVNNFSSIAKSAGLTNSELLNVVDTNEKLTSIFGDSLNSIRSSVDASTEFEHRQNAIANAAARRKAQEEEIARLIEEEQNAALARQQALIAQINDRYKDAAQRAQDLIDAHKTEEELILEQIKFYEGFDWGAGALQDRRNLAIEILKQDLADIKTERDAAFLSEEEKRAQAQEQADLARAERIRSIAEIARAQKAADEEEAKRIEELTNQRIEGARLIYDQLTSFAGNFFQYEIDQINASGASEKEKAIEVAKIKRKQAVVDKITASVSTGIAGAQAAIQAYAYLGPIGGVIAAAVIGGLTAANVGFILAQPLPEIPSFANGGIVPATPGGQVVRVSENNSPELLLNGGSSGDGLLNMFAERIAERIAINGQIAGTLSIVQNNLLNLSNEEGLTQAARVLYPYLKTEGVRRGD